MKKPNISFSSEAQSPRSYYHLSRFQLLLHTYAQSKYAYAITAKYVASKFIVPNKTVC